MKKIVVTLVDMDEMVNVGEMLKIAEITLSRSILASGIYWQSL